MKWSFRRYCSTPVAAVQRFLDVCGVVFEECTIVAPGVVAEAKVRYGVRVVPIAVIDGIAV